MAIKKVRIRPKGGNDYADIVHPETSADVVIESENKRFVSNAEKTNWNAKETTLGSQAKANTAESNANSYTDGQFAEKVKTNVPTNAKFTDTVYTHPTTAGNKHIPTGGNVGQILKNTASGTATWQAESVTPIANNLTETTIGKALDATQGKALDNKIGILNGNLTNLEYSELSSTATNIDDEGIYANIEWRRKNNTLYAKSTLLGISPNYNQVKMDYYDESGITIIKSITWDISYDDNGFPYQRMVI